MAESPALVIVWFAFPVFSKSCWVDDPAPAEMLPMPPLNPGSFNPTVFARAVRPALVKVETAVPRAMDPAADKYR